MSYSIVPFPKCESTIDARIAGISRGGGPKRVESRLRLSESFEQTELNNTDTPQLDHAFGFALARKALVWPVLVVLAVYAFGLTREISEPWTGLHDWNGAFFSQLARNHLRYPWELHHGMPLVAVGADAPPVDERSIYATHPPGLVWLTACAFKVLGESEAAARSVPIVASFASLVMLLVLWREAYGCLTALAAGLIYAVMPMAVYFGRMVDHEAVCLCLMLSAVTAWRHAVRIDRRAIFRATMIFLVIVSLATGAWIDWSGCLFAAVFSAYVLVRHRRRLQPGFVAAWIVSSAVAVSIGCMIGYLVYAGLGGRWGDLASIFFSRAGGAASDAALAAPGSAWRNTIENFTWPIIFLACIGMIADVMEALKRRRQRTSAEDAATEERGRDVRAATGAAFARHGLHLIALTGLIWLASFPRQYVIHAYWAFYLGPAFALAAGRCVLWVPRRWHGVGVNVRRGAAAGVLLAAVAYSVHGVGMYFARSEPILEDHVAAWRAIAASTRPSDRIALMADPTFVEHRGAYTFRNIVPPQFAYYVDRAFTVEPDPAGVVGLADSHVLYVMPVKQAVVRGASLRPLRERFSERLVSDVLVIFDLRSGAGD